MENKKDKLEKYEQLEKEQENSIEIDKTDEDILKNPQKEFSQGIETEEYDILPPQNQNSDLEKELENKESVKIEYTFNGEEVREGLALFQRETFLKRNIIYSLILACLFVVYTVNLIKDPKNMISLFLAVMCVVVLGFIWYIPKTHLKKTAQAADENQLKFTMDIYDNCIKIGEENSSYILAFKEQITKIFETDNLFLICAGKERVYIIPKRCLEKEIIIKLKNIFHKAMNENYFDRKLKD